MTRKIDPQTMGGSTNVVYRFYVVKFIESPNVDIDEYACVPESWLLHGCSERRVQVAYPSAESREITSDRVEREEEPWDEWNLYCAVVTYMTGAYYAAKYWIDQKMGKRHVNVNNDSADTGGNRPTAAPDNSSVSSGGSSPNLPSSDPRKFEVALANWTLPGLTVKKVYKRPASSAIFDNNKRPKRVEESTAVYNVSHMADRKSNKPIQSKPNRGCLGGQSKLVKAYDSETQSIMSALRRNSQEIPPETQADMDQRDFYQSVDSNRFAEQNIYFTHKVTGHPHMWPKSSTHIPAYQGYTYHNPQINPVNKNRDTNYIAYLRNGRYLNSAYRCSRIARSAPENPHLFDPREHPQDWPDINAQVINETKKPIPKSAHVINNNSTSYCRVCNQSPSKTSSNKYDLVNRLTIALLKERMNKNCPPEHRYE